MDAWGTLGTIFIVFPPATILGVALFAQLIALLNDKVLGWGKAIMIGCVAFVLALAGAIIFG